jgi:hypothetical protein
MNEGMDLPNEGIDEPVGENKGISGEFQGIEDVLDKNIASKDDSSSSSNSFVTYYGGCCQQGQQQCIDG